MMKACLSVLVVSALALNACGSDKGAPADGGSDAGNDVAGDVAGSVKVTISGTAAPHALTMALDPTNAGTQFNMLDVAMVDPVTVLASSTAPPLGHMTLDTS